LADYYVKAKAFYGAQFTVLQVFLFLVVILCVANSVNMSVFERTAEFGIMRALGQRPAGVFRLILLETALLGIIGATLGVCLGSLLAVVASWQGVPMPPPPNASVSYIARVRLTFTGLAGAFGVGVLAPVIAALLPAVRSSRIPLAAALRRLR
jgi:putative ABC transport system permease protein